MSAVSRPNSVEIWPIVRSAAADSAPPSQRTRIMKYLGFEQLGVVVAGERAVVALFALRVQAPPAETTAQIAFVDAVEAVLGVDVLDALPHVERRAGLLHLFVGVERLTIAQRPLALSYGASRDGLWSLGGSPSRTFASRQRAQLTGISSGGADPAASWTYRWAGSTTSRQTATAADTLEIDMPPRHQGDTQAGVGDGHARHSAMDTDELRNQVKFLLTVIKTSGSSLGVGRHRSETNRGNRDD